MKFSICGFKPSVRPGCNSHVDRTEFVLASSAWIEIIIRSRVCVSLRALDYVQGRSVKKTRIRRPREPVLWEQTPETHASSANQTPCNMARELSHLDKVAQLEVPATHGRG